MGSNIAASLVLIFVVAGLTLMAALWRLTKLARRHRQALTALRSSGDAAIDPNPLDLPAAAWPALSKGGIAELVCVGNWFGLPVNQIFGKRQEGNAPFCFEITANDDIHLTFQLYPKANRGEARLFAEHLAAVFQLQIDAAIHLKVVVLSAALAEQARLTLYLQHDLRNLAQWVMWIAADLSSSQDEEALLAIAKRMTISASHAAARAERILAAAHNNDTPEPQRLHIKHAICHAAELAGIGVTINGEAEIFIRPDLLDRALDNMFANVAPMLRTRPELSLMIDVMHQPQSPHIIVKINMPRLPSTTKFSPEKLFEPYASSRPGGLGLGLYQARNSLREAGGDLTADAREQEIIFFITLPKPKMFPV